MSIRRAIVIVAAAFSFASLSSVASTPVYTEDAGVHYEQRNGQTLPLNVSFVDENGIPRRLGASFAKTPVVLIFGYFRCNQLCSVISDAAVDALRQLRPEKVGRFELLYISIDPTDTPEAARDAKERDVRRFGRPGAEESWHYLTGTSSAVEQVTRAAGFGYRYDPGSKQYAHPSGFLLATPGGVISSYYLGVDFSEKDLATGMRRAADGKTGPSVFDLLLLCFHGQGISGKYGPLVWRVLQFATAATVLGLASLIGYLVWFERHTRMAEGGSR